MTYDDETWERIGRYLTRETSMAEIAEIERWMDADPARRALFDRVIDDWNGAVLPTTQIDVDAAWDRLTPRLGATPIIPLGSPLRRYWMPAAAVALLTIGTYLTVTARPSTTGTVDVVSAPAAAPRVEKSSIGERRRAIDLPDGSQIVLGPTSQITVPATFGTPDRAVDLQGEALFRVRHDAAHPFSVRVNGVTIEDLGTEFAVRSLPGAAHVRIAVASGSVALRRSAGDTIATLGQRDVAEVPAEGSAVVRHDQDVSRMLAFASGQLVFDNAPLRDVAAELGRYFEVDCKVGDPVISDLHYSGTFESEPLDEILNAVVLSLDGAVRFERSGRAVTFLPATTRPGTGSRAGSR